MADLALFDLTLLEDRLTALDAAPVAYAVDLAAALERSKLASPSLWIYETRVTPETALAYKARPVQVAQELAVMLLYRDATPDSGRSVSLDIAATRTAVINHLLAWVPGAPWSRLAWTGGRLLSAAGWQYVYEDRFTTTTEYRGV